MKLVKERQSKKILKRYLCLIILTIISVFFYTNSEIGRRRLLFTKQDGIEVYNKDFTKKYKRTLDTMFEKNWKVVSLEEKYDENSSQFTYMVTSPQKYSEWSIMYYDGDGNEQIFILNNRIFLEEQIVIYVEKYIERYYMYFFKEYLEKHSLSDKVYVDLQDYRPISNLDWTPYNYRKFLKIKTIIKLSEITSINIFEKCPLSLNITLNITNKEHSTKDIENMLSAMNEFFNFSLNAYIYTIDDNNSHNKLVFCYLFGERYTFNEENLIGSLGVHQINVYKGYKWFWE